MKGRSKIEVSDEFLNNVGHTRESYEKLSKSGKWSVRNREKHYLIQKATIAKKPEQYSKRHRKYLLQKNYNLTEEDYNNMLIKQNHKCAICNTSNLTGKWKSLVVDHDHKTGLVRELLCNECNRALGYFKDNFQILEKAAKYLIKHNKKTLKEKQSKKKL